VKLAQFLSARSDVLPEPWVRALSALQDSVPPRPFSEVSATLAEASAAGAAPSARVGE